jgi:hypothetical protein
MSNENVEKIGLAPKVPAAIKRGHSIESSLDVEIIKLGAKQKSSLLYGK